MAKARRRAPKTLPEALKAIANLQSRIAALEQATVEWDTPETETNWIGWAGWVGAPKDRVQTGFKVGIQGGVTAVKVHHVGLKIVPHP
jgi:hypothetical protein